jgi:hypothetical protein
VRFYKTAHEQTVQVVKEEKGRDVRSIIYQFAPDTHGFEAFCV